MARPHINEVTLPGIPAQKIGLRRDGDVVSIYLLNDTQLRPSSPIELMRMMTKACDICFDGAAVDAFHWRIRSGYAVTDVIVTKGASGTGMMQLSNELVVYSPAGALEDYRNDKFREFSPSRALRIPPPEREATYYLQSSQGGQTFFLRHRINSRPDSEDVVYVDAAKFMALLHEHAPHQMPLAAGGDWSEAPQSLIKVGCEERPHGLRFGIVAGGPDLLAAIVASKALAFPVAVDFTEAPLLRRLCGISGSGAAYNLSSHSYPNSMSK